MTRPALWLFGDVPHVKGGQWANDEFGGDGWKFKASGASFIHGWLDELLITVLITSWGVSWIVIDYTQDWSEQVIGSGRIEGQP